MMSHETRPDRVMQSIPAEPCDSCAACYFQPSPQMCQAFLDSLDKYSRRTWQCNGKRWRRIG